MPRWLVCCCMARAPGSRRLSGQRPLWQRSRACSPVRNRKESGATGSLFSGEENMTAKDTGIRISFSEDSQQGAKIKVFGVGGGGCNAVNRMIRAKVEGVEFITANTDLPALKLSQAPGKLHLG